MWLHGRLHRHGAGGIVLHRTRGPLPRPFQHPPGDCPLPRPSSHFLPRPRDGRPGNIDSPIRDLSVRTRTLHVGGAISRRQGLDLLRKTEMSGRSSSSALIMCLLRLRRWWVVMRVIITVKLRIRRRGRVRRAHRALVSLHARRGRGRRAA